MKTNIKRLLGFPFEEKQRAAIEHNLAQSGYRVHRIVCFVILGFQCIMIAFSLIRGVDFSSGISVGYFSLYLALMGLSLAAFLLSRAVMKGSGSGKRDRIYLAIQSVYGLLITLWGIAITLLDQYGGQGLDVFSYVSLAVASFVLFKPWQSVLLFTVECLALNLLLPLFPNGIEDMFGHAVNSLFICVLSIVISIVCYRGKCATYLDKLIIEDQYERIREMNLRLNRLAVTDDLTGMHNRRYLESLPCTERWKSAQKITGIMLDIDYFKQYNDTYGHVAGDQCLRQLAEIIGKLASEENAEAVRYGGEEFFLCLFDYGENAAQELAERLRRTVERSGGEGRTITVSLGVFVCGTPGEIFLSELLVKSDRALYEAKRRGRNRVVSEN